MTKLNLIFFLCSCSISYSQTKQSDFYGSWFASTGYTVVLYRIKRNGVGTRYHKGCTNRGDQATGNWSFQADSIQIYFDQDTVTFQIVNKRLIRTYVDPNESCANCGFKKTHRTSIPGTTSKWKHEQRKRRRQRRK